MDVPGLLEGPADGPDAPVHHVGRAHDVASGGRLIERLLLQRLDGLVVEDIAVLIHQPVLPVGCIGIERHVRHHADIRHLRLDGAHRPADQIFRIPGLAGVLGAPLVRGVGKQRDGGNAQIARFGHGLHQPVDGHALHAGHGGHGLSAVFPLDDEDRPDQVIGRQHGFAHEAARPFLAPGASGPSRRIGRVRMRCHDKSPKKYHSRGRKAPKARRCQLTKRSRPLRECARLNDNTCSARRAQGRNENDSCAPCWPPAPAPWRRCRRPSCAPRARKPPFCQTMPKGRPSP